MNFALDNKHLRRIVFAIACSFGVHIMLLLNMRHLSFQITSSQWQKKIDREVATSEAITAVKENKAEIHKRTQELAKIFHSLQEAVEEKPDPLLATSESVETPQGGSVEIQSSMPFEV